MNRPWINQKRGAVIIGSCLTGAIFVTFLLLPGEHTKKPAKVVANDYSNRATACLIADSSTSMANPVYKQIWDGMQTAVKNSSSNAQQLIAPVTDSTAAQPYLAGLINQKCDLIVAIGKPFGQAIPAVSKAAPQTHFIAVDSSLSSPPTPETTLLNATQAPTSVQNEISTLTRHR